jgi:carbon-monoxide dehydrogenase small subunit
MKVAQDMIDITARINGRTLHRQVATNLVLADLLRDQLDYKGVKIGCARTVCGACTVLIDGRPAASCSTFAFEIAGAAVETIESMAGDVTGRALQKAFAENSAFQCGYCTAGMILLGCALLREKASPTRADIVEWISSNICRCTGYALIVEAILAAAAELRGEIA